MLERHGDAGGAVTLDARWFPVVIATWSGTTDVGHVDTYNAWLDAQVARARRERTRIALINDGLDSVRPSAAVRQRFVASSRTRAVEQRDCVVSSFVVVRGAFLLGVIASVLSMLGIGVRLSTVADTRVALERSLARLDALGVPRPAGLDPASYVRPTLDAAA